MNVLMAIGCVLAVASVVATAVCIHVAIKQDSVIFVTSKEVTFVEDGRRTTRVLAVSDVARIQAIMSGPPARVVGYESSTPDLTTRIRLKPRAHNSAALNCSVPSGHLSHEYRLAG